MKMKKRVSGTINSRKIIGTCSMVGREKKMQTNFRLETADMKVPLEGPENKWRIVLICILKL